MASRELVLYHHPDCQHGGYRQGRARGPGGSLGGGELRRWVAFWVTPTVAVWLAIALFVAGLMVFPGAAKAIKGFAAQPATTKQAKQAKVGAGKPEAKTGPRQSAAERPAAKAGWSATATADIPTPYRTLYRTAARTCPKLTPWLLAGIGKVESDHGRSSAPGVRSGVNRAGCCAGPMQFNLTDGPPSTWATWRRPGDNVYDPADAIPAAARKLCANGLRVDASNRRYQGQADPCPTVGGSDAVNRALVRYNAACWYADQAIWHAQRYAPKGVRVA